MAEHDDSLIEAEEQGFPFDFKAMNQAEAVQAAKQEALHRVICGLYEAQRKNMGISDVLQAQRNWHSASTDDFGLAIHQFDAASWGCQG